MNNNEETVHFKGATGADGLDMILTILDGTNPVYELDLNTLRKDKITFGRNQANDIVLTSMIVSNFHGYFSISGSKCTIYDTNSKNGIIVNGELTTNKQLKDGDSIRIDNLNSPVDKGIAILFSTHKIPKQWREFDLSLKDKIIIGRDESCDIRLKHVGVSRIHAIILKAEHNYYIKDNNSTNGISVNGKKINGKCLLKEKDIILITNSKMIFSKGKIIYRLFTDGIGLDAIGVVKTVKSKGGTRNISDNITLSIKPSEFVAIVGGSGAGKSTFMNCISGYSRATSGRVIVNGEDLYANYSVLKNIIGYVPQQDIIYDNLTLKSMLLYTAEMRMPKDTTASERHERVAQVIKIVELTGRENTFIRQLSGGQKKRASIAVELLADPSLFFLDEPSSGLDPGTERNLMKTMRAMADRGKTVIMVTHNTLNLHLCDRIIFLGNGGKLSFCGTPKEAMDFFETCDLVDIYNLLNDNTDNWSEKYNRSKYKSMPQFSPLNKNDSKYEGNKKKYPTIKQLGILSRRYISLLINDKKRLLMLILQAPLLGVLISTVNRDNVFENYNMSKAILFALTCAAFWVGMLNSIQEICKEGAILKREYMAVLKPFPYIGSKILVLGLICAIQSVLLMGAFALTIGVPDRGLVMNVFMEMLITTFLTAFSASALGLAISAFTDNPDRAMTLAPIMLMPQMLFSGVLFKLEGITDKISYLAISRWAMQAYGITANLNSLQLDIQKEFPAITHKAEAFFEQKANTLLNDWKVLALAIVVFSFVCVAGIACINRNNR